MASPRVSRTADCSDHVVGYEANPAVVEVTCRTYKSNISTCTYEIRQLMVRNKLTSDMIASTTFLDGVNSTSRTWADFGIIKEVLLTCFFSFQALFVKLVELVAGEIIVPWQVVVEACLKAACFASHDGLRSTRFVKLTRIAGWVEAHDEVWEVTYH